MYLLPRNSTYVCYHIYFAKKTCKSIEVRRFVNAVPHFHGHYEVASRSRVSHYRRLMTKETRKNGTHQIESCFQFFSYL